MWTNFNSKIEKIISSSLLEFLRKTVNYYLGRNIIFTKNEISTNYLSFSEKNEQEIIEGIAPILNKNVINKNYIN